MEFTTLSKKDYFNIAKLIDNNFIGTEDNFTVKRIKDYYLLNTNKCDDCSIVKIYQNINSMNIIKIERIASDTNGYEEISKSTYLKIKSFIRTLFT